MVGGETPAALPSLCRGRLRPRALGRERSMANTRIMLWFAFFAILYLNYEAWMRDYQPPAVTTVMPAAGSPGAAKSLADIVPTAPAAPATQSPAPSSDRGASPAVPAAATGADSSAAAPGPALHVVTDVLNLDINLRGGEIERADLTEY